mmetsp:Transcript_83809/g.260458  ORF Transcript_83809/g.260458 Transcript_83809/m.260458 type:complete len:210 (-) Transcript_83809:786-1415(-)
MRGGCQGPVQARPPAGDEVCAGPADVQPVRRRRESAAGDGDPREDHHQARVPASSGVWRGGRQHHRPQHEGPPQRGHQRDDPGYEAEHHHWRRPGPRLHRHHGGAPGEDQRLLQPDCGDRPWCLQRVPRCPEQEQRRHFSGHLAPRRQRAVRPQRADGRDVRRRLCDHPRGLAPVSAAGGLPIAPGDAEPPGQELPREPELRPALRLGD